MKRTRIALTGTAVAAAAALVLVPSAAVGHTDTLFTWAYSPVGSDIGGFATTSKTDAALALLGEDTLPIMDEVTGMEVCDENGYAVGWAEENSELDLPVIATWDHTTGAILTGPTEITFDEQWMINEIYELDTLADCSVVTITYLNGEGFLWAISEVDPATGDADVLIELPVPDGVLDYYEYTGLATTSTGTTYVFLEVDSYPYVATVDFTAGTIGDAAPLAGLSDYFESSGFTQGVDFDAVDGLWIVTGVNEEEQYHLASYAAGADLPLAAPTDIGILPYSGDLQIYAPIPLTAEGGTAVAPVEPAKPQLAATGVEAPLGIAAAALALLVAGGAALVLRRRAA